MMGKRAVMQAEEGMPEQLQRKEKTTPFGVNLMRSQVLYLAAYRQLQTLWTAHLDHTLAVLLSTALVMSATIQTALQDFMYSQQLLHGQHWHHAHLVGPQPQPQWKAPEDGKQFQHSISLSSVQLSRCFQLAATILQ